MSSDDPRGWLRELRETFAAGTPGERRLVRGGTRLNFEGPMVGVATDSRTVVALCGDSRQEASVADARAIAAATGGEDGLLVALVDVALALHQSGYRDPRVDAALARLRKAQGRGRTPREDDRG